MLTRKGARRLTSMLDQVATVVQGNPSVLGVDGRIAADFAYRCDLLSDAIETRAVNNFPRQASEHDDEEEAEDEAPEAPKAEKKASFRPQPRKPANGVTRLGGGVTKEASASNDLSKLWDSAPDVSKYF